MADRVRDRVAIVTGAGSIGPGLGNGKAISCLLAREGAKVLCIDRNANAAAETVALIRDNGGTAGLCSADVTDPAQVARAVEEAKTLYGRVDILCNNVGIAEVGGVVELPVETWDHVFDVNLKSCFLMMKHVIPHMVDQGGGSIINISSVASLRHSGVAYASYSASKAAMNHLTHTTAVEYAPHKVRVNSVLPGLMKTPMVEHSASLAGRYGHGDIEEMWRVRAAQCPMGIMGDAWDVAYAVLFLASDESRYVTGIDLVVDGGITLKFA